MCRLCLAEGRHYLGHAMATCGYIGSAEKRAMVTTYKVDAMYDDEDECDAEIDV